MSSIPMKKTKSKKHPDSACSGAEHLVEAGGLQSGGSRASREFGDRVWVGGVYAAGLVQSHGFEHRWAACHYVGEQVAASIGGPTTIWSAAVVPVSLTASAKLMPTWNTCGSVSRTAVSRVMKFSGAKKPPALAQMQPTGGCALGAALEP
jgi:hypothetical protein